MNRYLITFALGLSLASSLVAQVTVANLSTRSQVGTGDDILIVGVVVEGETEDYKPVLLRGVGPWLADYAVMNALEDPRISLFHEMDQIAVNDDWMTGGQSFAITATGYSPHYETEGALIAMLTPGNYTMHLDGKGAAGVGLAEAYFIEEKTLPENLTSAGSFATLVAAAQAAGLVETLAGSGPFTLFAPTDEAFAALPAGTVEGLLNDIPALTDILLYHVVAGAEVFSGQIEAGPLMMANGSPSSLSVDAGVMIDAANIVEADWMGSNGVLHVVDSVILPPVAPSTQTIVENLVAQGDFTTLVAAVQAADLVDTLNAAGPYTLFAPTDAAFAALPAGTVAALLNDIPTLKNILLYHVVPNAQVLSNQIVAGPVPMANGDTATLSLDEGAMIDQANITGADWLSSNGVIHFIDAVILPTP